MLKQRSSRISSQDGPAVPRAGVDVEIVRFEKNLLQSGFFGAHDLRDKSRTTRRIEQIVFRDGHKVKVAAEFRGSEALGLPSTADRDKFIALLKIMSEERDWNGQVQNPVRFSGYRLIQELGLSRNGEIYDEISRWGKRMSDTTITSEQVVYFAARQVYSDETLHVFRSFKRTGHSRLDGAERQEQYEVVLEDWLIENLNQRYVVLEDFNAYKKLTRPTAKGIFGYLHLWFHASQGRPVEKDYAELCNLLNVQVYPHLSKIRTTMGLALDELVKIQYVGIWTIEKMTSKKGFKVVLTPGSELLRLLDSSKSERKLPPKAVEQQKSLSQTEQSALKLLLAHGIMQSKAEGLIRQFGAQRVTAIAEYVESQLFGPAGQKITNPAGLMIHSIENDLPIPAWFVTSEMKRESGQLDERMRVEEEQRAQMELQYSLWVSNQTEALIMSVFSKDQLKAKLSELIRDGEGYRRMSEQAKRSRALYMLGIELRREYPIPSFEDWIASELERSDDSVEKVDRRFPND